MTMYRANGTQITKSTAQTLVTEQPETDPLVQVEERLYEAGKADGTKFPSPRRILRFHEGQIIRQSELDAYFPAPTIESVTPVTGPAAGGTLVTIKVTNATPGTTVAFGGTAATSVTVVDDTTITCLNPAKTAGAVAVAVTNDSATATAANAFTYTA
ncbi:IPT/TIG domain-containing protein [Sinosporangium album]|uniref:IPT/TIG domain-containing protein n=1 Tax=Sinosporangium album TaxID=504805 RepID=A0A1G8ECJ6_9ACTN|nr:IPT/TIG domain-containing protein [Sinosporangium album]SDH67577.1 IPT/TIG domain-containing protein [Sinosporangium album]